MSSLVPGGEEGDAEVRTRPALVVEADWTQVLSDCPDVTVVSTPEGRYRHVSPASARVFGWSPLHLEGRHEQELADPDDLPLLAGHRVQLLKRAGEPATTSFRFRCEDGSFRWVEMTSRLVGTDAAAVVVSSLRDITERQQVNLDLQRQASTDPLTGVANRTVLLDRLHQGLRRLERAPGAVAVLALDLDRFKVINDSLGHAMGDEVLLKLAERLEAHMRPADTLARLGGDEFVIVAEGLEDELATRQLVDRIIASGREPFVVAGQSFICTVSIGVASSSDPRRNALELLREADLALYRAKNRGRDRAEFFDEQLRIRAVHRVATEQRIRLAIAAGGLVVHYQPIVDLPTREIVGVEALVRLQDEHSQLLYPADFLEVAEESGLLPAIDDYVLDHALMHAAPWLNDPETRLLSISVNVNGRHLADTSFHGLMLSQLAAAGVAPERLQVQVTERLLMEASTATLHGLHALRDAGVQIGLDDFGTGYASLAYLQQFPLDFLKLDSSFVEDLEDNAAGQAMVGAVISIARALELTVIAEGVQTSGQLAVLEALGCDRVQGFLFSAALSAEDLGVLLGIS